MRTFLKLLGAFIMLSACSEHIEDGNYDALKSGPYEALSVSINDDYMVAQAACDNGKKVLVCHVPPGNPDAKHTICIGMAAVETHLDHHADYLGDCEAPPVPSPEPTAAPTPEPSPNPDPGGEPTPTPVPSPDPDLGDGGTPTPVPSPDPDLSF
jgi:hypothetical protein